MKKLAMAALFSLTACAHNAAAEPQSVLQQAGSPPCSTYEAMAKSLLKSHKETPRLFIMTSTDNLLVLLASDEGSWSIIMVSPEKMACIFKVGDGWGLLDMPGEPS